MPEIISITSEALQATVRRLLPSQQGFGNDLQATNLVTPIIDLTPTAEGSVLPSYLQRALAFGSQTAFSVSSTTSTIITTTGFFQINGVITARSDDNSDRVSSILLNDGSSDKVIWGINAELLDSGNNALATVELDLIVFIPSGHSCKILAGPNANAIGSTRQVATVTGNLVAPSGFTFE